MSKTIIPNRKLKEDFFTNISAEKAYGQILRIAGAKHFYMKNAGYEDIDMPNQMDHMEALNAAMKLGALLIDSKMRAKAWEVTASYFAKGSTEKDMMIFVTTFMMFLLESGGYECLG